MGRGKLAVLGGLALVAVLGVGRAGEPGAVPLDEAASLIEHHRYRQAIALLEPFADREDLEAEIRFWVDADLGVSYFTWPATGGRTGSSGAPPSSSRPTERSRCTARPRRG